jgi:hypothetical protein
MHTPPEGREPLSDPQRAVIYEFIELLHLANEMSSELRGPGDRCQIPVILAAMSVEALLNDMAYMAEQDSSNSHAGVRTLASVSQHLASDRVRPRLLMYFHLLTGEHLDTGVEPYQSFDNLVRLRNAFVHATPSEWVFRKGSDTKEPVRAMPSFMGFFATKLAPGAVVIRDLMTPAVAAWAVSTAERIVDHVCLRISGALPAPTFFLGFSRALRKRMTDRLRIPDPPEASPQSGSIGDKAVGGGPGSPDPA